MTQDGAPRPAGGYRLFVLAMLIVVYTFNFLDRQILAILATPIKKEFGISDGLFGLISGAGFALVYSTMAVPIAWVADRRSRSWIITIALTVWSGFTALCGTATSFWQIAAYRTGVGFGEAGGVAPSYSMIADYFPQHQRARALSAYSFAIPVGTALGVAVGGYVATTLGWRMAFLIVGLAGLALAPFFKLTVRDAPRPASATALPTKGPSFGSVLKVLLPKPSFWFLAFGAAASSLCGYGIAFWLPSFFQRSLGMSLLESSWFYAAIALIGGVMGIWLGGVLADRYGGRSKAAYPLIPAIAFVVALPIFFLAVNSNTKILTFFLALIPVGLNLAWLGPIVTAVQHLVPASMRTTAAALFLLINNLFGIALGYYYFGAVSDLLQPHFGTESLRYSIYTGLAFYGVAATLFILASRRLKRDWVD